jgi:hypothetical protein
MVFYSLSLVVLYVKKNNVYLSTNHFFLFLFFPMVINFVIYNLCALLLCFVCDDVNMKFIVFFHFIVNIVCTVCILFCHNIVTEFSFSKPRKKQTLTIVCVCCVIKYFVAHVLSILVYFSSSFCLFCH